MEQIQRFPAGYFAMIVSPVKIFRHRGALGAWKLILIFLFLNACLIAPLSLSFARAGNISLEQVAPHLNAAIQTGYTGHNAVLSFQNGVLQSGNAWTKEQGDTIISFDPRKTTAVSESRYHTKVAHYKNALLFRKDRLILADENGFGFSVRYPSGNEKITIQNGRDLASFAGALWFRQHKVILIPLVSCLIGILFLFSNILLMGAVSLILWLTRFSSFSGIRSLKQAATITLSAAGVPSIIAMLAGFAGAGAATMMMIQSLGMVLFIAMIFLKTKFLTDDM